MPPPAIASVGLGLETVEVVFDFAHAAATSIRATSSIRGIERTGSLLGSGLPMEGRGEGRIDCTGGTAINSGRYASFQGNA
jgi:hypothetical protein